MLALYLLSSAIVLASGKRARFVDLDGEVLPAVCKVVDEVTLKEHPECGIGAAFAAFGSADTTTCGLPTSIPAEKLAATTCTDAQAVIDAHNRVRARRGAQPLIWANTLAQSAKEVATRCLFAPSGTAYGEAIAWGRSLTCGAATELWISQEQNFVEGNPGFSSASGHFTQAVWKSTTQVGCFVASCGSAGAPTELVVCHYNPPGNFLASFQTNVGADGEPSPCDDDATLIPPIGQLPGITVPLPGLPPAQPCCVGGFCVPYLC